MSTCPKEFQGPNPNAKMSKNKKKKIRKKMKEQELLGMQIIQKDDQPFCLGESSLCNTC